MPTIHDEEFGTITIRRSARATQVRLRIAPNGTLRASLPVYAPLFLVKRLLKTSRPQLRKLLDESSPNTVYQDGMPIGKSHKLLVIHSPDDLQVKKEALNIIVSLPDEMTLNDSAVVKQLRAVIIKALRVEAKSYLPNRLKFLSDKHQLFYTSIRFSHASSRWGSCSSKGTISLNIALMKLPFELIDYVLIHELAHTKYMNHSEDFWQLVHQADPDYKAHRKLIRKEAPAI